MATTALNCEQTINVDELCHPHSLPWQCIDVRSTTEFGAGPIPAYFNMSDTGLALTLALLTALYCFIPQIAFNWHELTTRHA